MFAEGLSGTIDIPPITREMRNKIFDILKENKLISDEVDETQFSDADMFNLVSYYNFDIEVISEMPMMKSFNSSLNSVSHLSQEIIRGIRSAEGGGGWRTFLLFAVGTILGFFVGWSLTLKGVI